MSYILDALKKSEREKTLGQVPTLESVISDGTKKKRSGTPWWLNLVVFFVALFAVVAILKMTGLIDFRVPENEVTQQSPPSSAADNETVSQSLTQTSSEDSTQAEQSPVTEAAPEPIPAGIADAEAEEGKSVPEARTESAGPGDTEPAVQLTDGLNDNQAGSGQAVEMSQQLEQEFAAREAEDLAALELQAQQQSAELEASLTNSGIPGADQQQANPQQPSQPQYEEVLHDSLRDISVNVVSYSSNQRQRFVMLDMTIYKEGDQLANNALILEITRTGAIVEYQNNRYLLKP